MSFYPDLSFGCQGGWGADVRAVGWLSSAHPFARGPVPTAFTTALQAHLASLWQEVPVYCGFHQCDLPHQLRRRPWWRRSRVRDELPRGHLQLYIPTATCLYIAPQLIGHYISDHGYRPPEEFIDALMVCPPQGSPDFVARITPLRCADGSCPGFHFDRQGKALHVEAQRRLDAWVRRGMCPQCQFWFYLNDGDPAVHCGVPLIRLEDRGSAG